MPIVGFALLAILVIVVLVIALSITVIGPAEIGLVTKKLGFKGLDEGNPIALKGEAGYQADLLMPGLRFKLTETLRLSSILKIDMSESP